MKKIIFLAIMLIALPLGAAAAYKSGNVTLGRDSENNDTLIVSLSNGVSLDYGSDGKAYVVATSHDNGDRTYMSSSEDANIYWGDGTKASLPNVPTVGTSIGETEDFDQTL
jgi:hypothetical protein